MDQDKNIKEADFLKLFLKHEITTSFCQKFTAMWTNVDDVLQEASVVMWKNSISLM